VDGNSLSMSKTDKQAVLDWPIPEYFKVKMFIAYYLLKQNHETILYVITNKSGSNAKPDVLK